MKSIYSAVLAVALGAGVYAGNCGNVDIPISFTISSTYTDPFSLKSYNAAILSDGMGAYNNGQQNVSALIHTCNGSNNATLNTGLATGNGTRYVTWNFQNVVDTNSLTPSWTQQPANNPGFTIVNLLYNYNATATYSFTTYLNLANFHFPTTTYAFYIENPNAIAQNSAPNPNVNSPCDTSLVNVTHVPATSNSKETWIVWPDDTPVFCTSAVAGQHAQVGTLTTIGHPNWVSAGQFTVPFYVTIQRI